MMDIFEQLAAKIISKQKTIIGPLAEEQALKVTGLSVENNEVRLKGDKSKTLDDLVTQYRKLFGQTSVEVCREAAEPFLSKLPAGQMPKTLA